MLTDICNTTIRLQPELQLSVLYPADIKSINVQFLKIKPAVVEKYTVLIGHRFVGDAWMQWEGDNTLSIHTYLIPHKSGLEYVAALDCDYVLRWKAHKARRFRYPNLVARLTSQRDFHLMVVLKDRPGVKEKHIEDILWIINSGNTFGEYFQSVFSGVQKNCCGLTL